jgi:transcriptional regulator with XRE-family HTH domain
MTELEPTPAQLVGGLLRSRRERLSPADVGLPAGSRRRTAGLRREEVAQLANISATYYTFLEQGRDIRPSRKVLDALAAALQLDRSERTHLHELAAGRGGAGRSVPHETLAPGLGDVVDHLDPRPTYVTGRYWDVLAANRAARALWTDWPALPAGDRNMLWWTFTAPAAREVLVDWEAEATNLLASFRAAAARNLDDPGFTAMLSRLKAASSEVRDWWPRQGNSSASPASGLTRLRHPDLGIVALRHTVLQAADDSDQRLVTFDADADHFDQVAALVEDFSLGVALRSS